MKWEHLASKLWNKSQHKILSITLTNNKREEWIVDSKCSHHVTGDDYLFSEIRDYYGDRVIITTNDSTYSVAKEGVVKIEAAGDKS